MIKTEKRKQRSTKLGKLIPGNLITLKITAVGPNNVGINEFSFGIPILVPKAKLGDIVQVKVLKFLSTKKMVIAKLVKVITSTENKQDNTKLPTLTPGTCLDITINTLGPNSTGIVILPNIYNNVTKLIVKKPLINVAEKLTVEVTHVKKGYAFAVVDSSVLSEQAFDSKQTNLRLHFEENQVNPKPVVFKGTKFTLVLPKKAKRYLKHFVFKVANNVQQKTAVNGFVGLANSENEQTLLKKGIAYNMQKFGVDNTVNNSYGEYCLPTNTILFVKPSLGAKLGDKVQIQITKFFKINGTLKYNVAIAKIIKLNPISASQKKTLIRASVCQMLRCGMHYGEKAIKCNARMKNFVWTRKKTMYNKAGLIREARPLIKKGRNIINLLKTRRCLNKALAQLTKYAVKGKTFLFVGTKKAASGLVSRAALFSKKAFFVNTRWLGGMLTNWKTILKSISKIRPILKEKQMIIKDILEKRQNIKTRLIQKALLLRKKTKLMVTKGRLLIQTLRLHNSTNGNSFTQNRFLFAEKTNFINNKRKEFVSKGILLLEKQRQLSVKQKELIVQSQVLKSKASQLTNTYRQLLNNLMLSRKKLRELKALLLLSKELQTFKQNAKQDQQNVYMVSYNKYVSLNQAKGSSEGDDFIISNPPKEILNKMVSLIKGQSLILKNTNLNLKSITTTKTLILSQLLSKFNLFVPTIKVKIKNLQTFISMQKTSLNKVLILLNTLKNQMRIYLTLKNKLMIELQKIKQTLLIERNIIRVLRRKLKQISAQKRLIKFLRNLRYLPTPANKIEQIARFLMKKFVDPKMKYPMDSIYDEKLSRQTKKVAASRKKKWQRLEKYLGGISNMTKIKEKQIHNNVAIIIGQQEEMNAVRECQKLGIKMFHIVDTNCNPGFADHFIPANDDARNSIKFILGKFLTRIRLAQKLKLSFKKAKNKKAKNK